MCLLKIVLSSPCNSVQVVTSLLSLQDVEQYKAQVRDDVETWLRELTTRGIGDWLIVVVETLDAKRANKLLPRTTVLDRMRADFAPKQGDRCISVLNPCRQENRTADSWRGLVARVRYLVLVAYARAVTRLEEHVRAQRERRNEPGWHFLAYFRLQEELAQTLEMLGLHDEALVQYDELDALFSQFVVNAHAGEAAEWLSSFQRPLERWWGLGLEDEQGHLPDEPSLLELRAYLFSRQARALLAGGRRCEVAARCLPLLHGCVRELALLEVPAPAGAVACWLFLAALEVLRACEPSSTTPAPPTEQHSLHTAGLWAYAASKLAELGRLCGLKPGGGGDSSAESGPTSEQLHSAVGLSAGMGDPLSASSPTDKLKEALCSQEAFNRHYLELSELAMGTYKHVGRLRSARLVGRELASFYKLLGETQKAAAFLSDALKTFEQEGWRELAAHTHIELAACHQQAGDGRRGVRDAAAVAAAPEVDTLARCRHFDDMLAAAERLERTLQAPFAGAFRVIGATFRYPEVAQDSTFRDPQVAQDSTLHVDLTVECSFPREVVCTRVSAEVVEAATTESQQPSHGDRLKMHRHLDYRQDRQVASASVVCRGAPPPLKRVDSNRGAPARAVASTNVEWPLSLELYSTPVSLTPGANTVHLRWRSAVPPGGYTLGRVRICLGRLEFVSAAPTLTIGGGFTVVRREPELRLDRAGATGGELLAGLEQKLVLSVTVGSYAIDEDAHVTLRCSRGLRLTGPEDESDAAVLKLPLAVGPGELTRVELTAFAELPAREHLVHVQCPWSTAAIAVSLGFSAPITATWRLHTAARRKFLQVTVSGHRETGVRVRRAELRAIDPGTTGLTALNPSDKPDGWPVGAGLSLSCMWELHPPAANPPMLRCEFRAEYAPFEEEVWRPYVHGVDVVDYEVSNHMSFNKIVILCN